MYFLLKNKKSSFLQNKNTLAEIAEWGVASVSDLDLVNSGSRSRYFAESGSRPKFKKIAIGSYYHKQSGSESETLGIAIWLASTWHGILEGFLAVIPCNIVMWNQRR
jgi:hypothetical protein